MSQLVTRIQTPHINLLNNPHPTLSHEGEGEIEGQVIL